MTDEPTKNHASLSFDDNEAARNLFGPRGENLRYRMHAQNPIEGVRSISREPSTLIGTNPKVAVDDVAVDDEQEKDGEGGKKKLSDRWKKREPGKLPPRPVTSSRDSREAAADMLKRFFNRG